MRKIVGLSIFLALLLSDFLAINAQTGPSGKYLNFNGTDQYMAIPSCQDLNISKGESLTLSVRLLATGFENNGSILSKGHLLSGGNWWELATYRSTSGPNLGFLMRSSENIDLGAPYFARIEPGTWYHLAWVYNPPEKSLKIYLNGTLVKTVINAAITRSGIENDRELTVGCSWNEAGEPAPFQFWPGDIDELRVWKRALTAEEIRSDGSAAQASAKDLVAAYDFENITTGNVPDVSGRGHIAHLHGYGIRMVRSQRPAGRGNTDEPLVGFCVNGSSDRTTVTMIAVDLSGTTSLKDIRLLKVYCNGPSERLNPATARLFGQCVPVKGKMVIFGSQDLANTENYFWVTADISPDAPEGNVIQSALLSYVASGKDPIALPQLKGSRTILLTGKLLFSGGEGGSKHYRIPAIVTARDGSIVVACDKRWNSADDLPAHIDVVSRRSTDLGQTWSPPVTIAGEGVNSGFGDPALVLNRRNGQVICLFAGTQGFFSSTAAYPIRIYQSTSGDNGISWTSPKDLTPQIYGAESTNPVTQGWQGAFVTSGSALQLRSGRLMAVMPVREGETRAVSNFVLYSDDKARTWKVSPNRAATRGNEGKMVELDNGNILMSIRNEGNRLFTLSKDRGLTWGESWPQTSIQDPGCNGDLIRYTSISDGFNRNRLLHSIPFAAYRGNVSVMLSYDEGRTWPVRKTIYPGPSAYSSLCILPDGTIGIFYEVGEYETYQMYFNRFSLSWLTDGADTYSDKWNTGIRTEAEWVTAAKELRIYPNPAEDYVIIQGLPAEGITVSIIGSDGRLVRELFSGESRDELRVSLEGIGPGIYFVKAGGKTEKIVIR